MTDTSTVTDYSLTHEFLGSLQGSDGQAPVDQCHLRAYLV